MSKKIRKFVRGQEKY